MYECIRVNVRSSILPDSMINEEGDLDNESEDSDFEMQTSNFEREMFSNKAVTSLNRQSANSTGSTIARYGIPTPMVVD